MIVIPYRRIRAAELAARDALRPRIHVVGAEPAVPPPPPAGSTIDTAKRWLADALERARGYLRDAAELPAKARARVAEKVREMVAPIVETAREVDEALVARGKLILDEAGELARDVGLGAAGIAALVVVGVMLMKGR